MDSRALSGKKRICGTRLLPSLETASAGKPELPTVGFLCLDTARILGWMILGHGVTPDSSVPQGSFAGSLASTH